MSEALKLQYNERLSIDRTDIFQNSTQVYPDSYQEFQNAIQSIFVKTELLLKCKLEFERLISIELPNTFTSSQGCNDELNLSLIFTGAVKSGRSSLINMLLNTKVLPTSLIGSSCCLLLTHPKNNSRLISVGVHDLDGWEVDKYSGIAISDLHMKIASLQQGLTRSARDKNNKYNRRIHVQLPHWLLKNINIYECPAIDGMYSFEEPFDIIGKVKHPILIHVIDASNGLMQWDRTFLSKLQHNWPQMPTFFVINHVDIPQNNYSRDQGPRFLSISDKFKLEILESESTESYSSEDNISDSPIVDDGFNDDMVFKEQKRMIERSLNHLKKVGFNVNNGLMTLFAALSVKEFLNELTVEREKKTCFWNMVELFFKTFREFLNVWFEHLIIMTSLELKSNINGIVDAIRCQILSVNDVVYEMSSDAHLREIRTTEDKIKNEFLYLQSDFEKQMEKSVKDQLKKYEQSIGILLPDLEETEGTEIIRSIKPKLLERFQSILLGVFDGYSLDDEITRILGQVYKRLDAVFIDNNKYNKMLTFFQYELNLFRILKRTMVCPLITNLPDDIIQTEQKWYKELLRAASRKLRRNNLGNQNLTTILIDDIKVSTVIRATQISLSSILKQVQNFTKTYKETYRMVRSLAQTIISPEIFKRLLLVDFVLKVIERSFRKHKCTSKMEDLIKMQDYFNEFYDLDNHMVKCIDILSFTSLTDVVNILCFHRLCQPSRFVMSHESTTLLDSGICLLYYSKMHYDLLTAIQKNTEWSTRDVVGIMKQLACAVKVIQPYQKYIHIDLLPENIMLKKDSRNLHDCVLFPYSAEISSIGYQYRSKRKFKTNFNGVIFQLGMVLSWLLTNDIWVCAMITCDSKCPETEFYDHLFYRTILSLKETNLIRVAINLLFKTDEYSTLDIVTKEFDIIKDT